MDLIFDCIKMYAVSHISFLMITYQIENLETNQKKKKKLTINILLIVNIYKKLHST